jgi:hypothetical protein
VADGRLVPAEFDERVDAALAACTIDALASLTADLIAAPGRGGALTLPVAGTPAEPAAELLTISEKHGSVRRDGRWTLPHRLALRTAWCDVVLDLTSAVRGGPELVIELRVRGGGVELILAPRSRSQRASSMALSAACDAPCPELNDGAAGATTFIRLRFSRSPLCRDRVGHAHIDSTTGLDISG